jgi:hypothetical protein
VVWSSPTITAFAIAPGLQPGTVLIGTSDKGRIYSVTNDGRDTLLLQSSEGQISALFTRGNQVYASSSNQGKLFNFGAGLVVKELMNRQSGTQSLLHHGDVFGGVVLATSNCRRELGMASGQMRPGVIGALFIKILRAPRLQARARDLFNGARLCARVRTHLLRHGPRTSVLPICRVTLPPRFCR